MSEQYTPDEMDARGCFLDGAAGAFVREDWEAFLAKVRRTAAREALDGLADEANHVTWEMDGPSFALRVRRFKNRHYPEEVSP